VNLQWWDWVGLAGTVSILFGFFMLQTGKLHGQGIVFQLTNLLGALGILVSLYGKFNVSVFLLEGTWALISGYGIWRGMRSDKKPLR
jgi:paired small multidrug resistance pump